MCGGGGSSAPPPPAPPPPPPEPPKPVDKAVQESRKAARERLRQSRGRQGTILTGARGLLNEANVGRSTLLGQA